MKDIIREAFERECFPNFVDIGTLKRNPKGEYTSPILEDHWQTFMEGWDAATEHLKNKRNPSYTDIVSDGGMDPR